MPDDNPGLSHLHDRVNELAAETRDRDSRIELRHERLQAQVEAQTTNVNRLEKVCESTATANAETADANAVNAADMVELRSMHKQSIAESAQLCKAIDQVDRDERIRNQRLHDDLDKRREPLDWKGVLMRAMAAVIAAGVIAGATWMFVSKMGG